MSDFFKKNWFVVLIALIFACISTFYIYDTNKGKLKGKTANGEDVVYSITNPNGEVTDVTISDYYDELYKAKSPDALVILFERAVANAGVDTTNEMKDNAAAQASAIIQNYQTQYGSLYEEYLNAALAETGYSDLEEYLIVSQKINKLSADYAKKNFTDLKIREISYILIQHEDPENVGQEPSEDEQARMDAVDEFLLSGKTFAEAAAEFSEDSSTAESGGVLGVIDTNTTSLDNAFFEASMALNEGEVSEWVHSTNFGYFKIMCNASTQETLEANYTEEDPYEALTTTYDTTLSSLAIWEKAEELGIDFKGDANLESLIKESLGIADPAPSQSTQTDDKEETTDTENEATDTENEETETQDTEKEGGD